MDLQLMMSFLIKLIRRLVRMAGSCCFVTTTAAAWWFLLVVVVLHAVDGLSSSSSTSAPAVHNNNIIHVLYAGYPNLYPEYQTHLQHEFAKLELFNVCLTDDLQFDPSRIDYIIYNPKSELQDFSPYNNNKVKAVFNLQAGANAVVNNPTLSKSIPLTRMMDAGLRDGMVEYVVGHVLRHHLHMDQFQKDSQAGVWNNPTARVNRILARERTVGILGLGELGRSCAEALTRLNFRLYGWSRTTNKKVMNGITCCHGPSGLDQMLEQSDILVMLLPDTPETRNIINSKTLAKCKPNLCLINAGRGSSIDEDDLLQALNDGTIAFATLDVFQNEPLPDDHAFWNHPQILVTPHVAAKSSARTAAQVVAENMRRAETGQELLYLVDRDAGY